MGLDGEYQLRRDIDRLWRRTNTIENVDDYYIQSSVPAVLVVDGECSPSVLTFNSYKSNVSGVSFYDGVLKVYSSVDGTDYELIKEEDNVHSISVQPSPDTPYYIGRLFDGDKELDYQTVPVINNSKDNVVIFLDNETQLIPCNVNGAVSMNMVVTVSFYVYKGATLTPATISCSDITLPSGVSISECVDGSVSNEGYITFSISEGATLGGAKTGVISIPLIVDGVEYERKFNWAKIIDGVNGENAYVHIAYANSPDGVTDFTVSVPDTPMLYIGQYTDNVIESSNDSSKYTWSLIKGEDGQDGVGLDDLSDEEISNRLDGVNINAGMLDGNPSDNFIKSDLDYITIYRDDSDTSKNYVTAYKVGNIVIVSIYNFSGDKNVEVDESDEYYFKLLPNSKQLPSKYCPTNSQYISDLNTSFSSNGRLKISPSGQLSKLITDDILAGGYNNTYGTFIYSVYDRDSTTLTGDTNLTIVSGDAIFTTLKSGSNNLSGKSVQYTVNNISYYKSTNNEGKSGLNINLNQGNYNVTSQFLGDAGYSASNIVSTNLTVNRATATIRVNNAPISNNQTFVTSSLSISVVNQNNKVLQNIELNINGKTYNTGSNGVLTYKVSSQTSLTISVTSSNSLRISSTVNNNVTIIASPFTIVTGGGTITKSPLNVISDGESGQYNSWENGTNNASRVQYAENTTDPSIAMLCTLNGNGYDRHVTPSKATFNVFQFPNLSQYSTRTVTAKVHYGLFSVSGGGNFTPNMAAPRITVEDIYTGTVYATLNSPALSLSNHYFSATGTFTISAGNLLSDNLAVVVRAGRNYSNTGVSYNRAQFRIDYVELKCEYQ